MISTEGPASSFGPISIRLPTNLSGYSSSVWELPMTCNLPTSLPPMTVEEEQEVMLLLYSVADPEPYLDPDPYWIRIRWATDAGSGSVFGIRIRIRINVFNFA